MKLEKKIVGIQIGLTIAIGIFWKKMHFLKKKFSGGSAKINSAKTKDGESHMTKKCFSRIKLQYNSKIGEDSLDYQPFQ